MKNKNNVLHQLDKMDNLANQLNFIVKQDQPIETYVEGINKLKEIIEQTRLFVESEPTMYN
jgi:hypothetical protein